MPLILCLLNNFVVLKLSLKKRYLKTTVIDRESSRVAQWKRAGPITKKSEDQNLALLDVIFSLFVK